MLHVYAFFGGRSTLFAWVFTIAGVFALFFGFLSGAQFVALGGMVHGFVIVRAVSEDKYCNGAAPDDHNSFDRTELKGDRSSP